MKRESDRRDSAVARIRGGDTLPHSLRSGQAVCRYGEESGHSRLRPYRPIVFQHFSFSAFQHFRKEPPLIPPVELGGNLSSPPQLNWG